MKVSGRRNLVIYAVCLVVFVGLSWLVYQAGGGLGKAFKPIEPKSIEPKGYLGSEEPKGYLGIEYDESLIFTRVLPNSPAEDAGLKVGDRIYSINGARPITRLDVSELISKNRPGSTIKITILRADKNKTLAKMTFSATLVKRPKE